MMHKPGIHVIFAIQNKIDLNPALHCIPKGTDASKTLDYLLASHWNTIFISGCGLLPCKTNHPLLTFAIIFPVAIVSIAVVPCLRIKHIFNLSIDFSQIQVGRLDLK
jgi:hypothetical protein